MPLLFGAALTAGFEVMLPCDALASAAEASGREKNSSSGAHAQPNSEAHPLPAQIDFNSYFDTRNYTTLTVNAFAALPYYFSYFSFVDWDTAAPPAAFPRDLGDANQAYTEQNLTWGDRYSWPVELHLQWALGTNPFVQDRLRAGLRFGVPLGWALGATLRDAGFDVLTLTYFPAVIRLASPPAAEGYESQLALFYRFVPFRDAWHRRLYLAGWADLDVLTEDPRQTRFMTEHQLGLRLLGGLHAVAEYRHTPFAVPENQNGVALGLQYWLKLSTPAKQEW
jgi:hypothetical protein